MERAKAISNILPYIKAGDIMDALEDMDAAVFNSGLGGVLTVNFNAALLFCVGIAIGKHEARQYRKEREANDVR